MELLLTIFSISITFILSFFKSSITFAILSSTFEVELPGNFAPIFFPLILLLWLFDIFLRLVIFLELLLTIFARSLTILTSCITWPARPIVVFCMFKIFLEGSTELPPLKLSAKIIVFLSCELKFFKSLGSGIVHLLFLF